MKNRNILFTTIILLLAYLVYPQRVQATDLGGVLPGGNNADGFGVLTGLTTGRFNTGNGWFSLHSLTEGSSNTAVGAATLFSNTIAFNNTATGAAALFSNTTGISNTANGLQALFNNTTGGGNTANGLQALAFNTTGSGNIALGVGAGSNITTADNVICIDALGANVSDSCFIDEIYSNIQPIVGTDPDVVTINSIGRLGRANVSSRRYKHDIKPMDKASEVLFALKPVSFRYNKEYDATQTIAFGLIAEEVAEATPDLVGRNDKGQPESVRYEQINAMLLNEFLKEHKKVEEQEATIKQLKKDFRATVAELTAQLKEQAAQIQKVSAQIQMNKPAPKVVLNNR
jgi:hypothetical protein